MEPVVLDRVGPRVQLVVFPLDYLLLQLDLVPSRRVVVVPPVEGRRLVVDQFGLALCFFGFSQTLAYLLLVGRLRHSRIQNSSPAGPCGVTQANELWIFLHFLETRFPLVVCRHVVVLDQFAGNVSNRIIIVVVLFVFELGREVRDQVDGLFDF